MSIQKELAVIVPCFNEQAVLPRFYREMSKIAAQLTGLNLNILFIDDGSNDSTLQLIKDIKKNDDRVNYISFSRNFGKEAAIYAGLQNADGDYVALIDADLQHPPELIKVMYKKLIESGQDCIAARRSDRKEDPFVRTFFTNMFYRLINMISDVPIIDGVGDFRLMTRQMVNSILQISEYNRFSKGIFAWVGFNTIFVPYDVSERVAGRTKWPLRKLFAYSVSGITSFSSKPLLISSYLGVATSFLSISYLIYILVIAIIFGDPVAGYPSLVAIILFMGGIQLLGMGILGDYLSKTYAEVKRRPIYIVKEKSNLMQQIHE